MTEQAAIPVTIVSTFEKGAFFSIEPDIRGGGKGHGLRIANEDKLAPPGVYTMDPPSGDPAQYAERPLLEHVPKLGAMPRDLEGLAGLWIVSEPLKDVFSAIDPDGFAFAACDFKLADNSAGAPHFLCNVTRILDALNEEASKLSIEVSDDYVKGKYYDLSGGARLVFNPEIVGSSHIFRTPFSGNVFCDRVLHDALENAGLSGIWFTDAADF